MIINRINLFSSYPFFFLFTKHPPTGMPRIRPDNKVSPHRDQQANVHITWCKFWTILFDVSLVFPNSFQPELIRMHWIALHVNETRLPERTNEHGEWNFTSHFGACTFFYRINQIFTVSVFSFHFVSFAVVKMEFIMLREANCSDQLKVSGCTMLSVVFLLR